SAPYARVKSANFWLESALSGVVYATRLPCSSAIWIANSATSVLPAPVGAETITDWWCWIARAASIWKSSRGKENRARKRSTASICSRYHAARDRLTHRCDWRRRLPHYALRL